MVSHAEITCQSFRELSKAKLKEFAEDMSLSEFQNISSVSFGVPLGPLQFLCEELVLPLPAGTLCSLKGTSAA